MTEAVGPTVLAVEVGPTVVAEEEEVVVAGLAAAEVATGEGTKCLHPGKNSKS